MTATPLTERSGTGAPTDEAVLSFRDVDVRFATEFGTVHAVKGVSLDVMPGEVVALVGEVFLAEFQHGSFLRRAAGPGRRSPPPARR